MVENQKNKNHFQMRFFIVCISMSLCNVCPATLSSIFLALKTERKKPVELREALFRKCVTIVRIILLHDHNVSERKLRSANLTFAIRTSSRFSLFLAFCCQCSSETRRCLFGYARKKIFI